MSNNNPHLKTGYDFRMTGIIDLLTPTLFEMRLRTSEFDPSSPRLTATTRRVIVTAEMKDSFYEIWAINPDYDETKPERTLGHLYLDQKCRQSAPTEMVERAERDIKAVTDLCAKCSREGTTIPYNFIEGICERK